MVTGKSYNLSELWVDFQWKERRETNPVNLYEHLQK